ncbi:MAG: ABC transporter permease, partial [Acidobacteriota bacterium]
MTQRHDITSGTHVAGHLSDPQLASWRKALRREVESLGTTDPERDRIEEELAQMLRDEAAFEGLDLEAEGAAETWIAARRVHLEELLKELRPELPRKSALTSGVAPVGEPSRWSHLSAGLKLDLLLALRSFSKRPGLTAVILATLVLGIGLNSTVFSVLDSVLFRPLAVAESDRLLRVYSSVPDGFLPEEPMAYPDLVDLRESRAVEGIAAHATTFVAYSQGDQAEIVIAEMVSDDAFDLLGVRPLRGQLFSEGQANDGSVLLSAAAWRQRFDSSPEALGQTVRVNGHPLEIAGVLPGNFRGLQRPLQPQFWITLETAERIGAFPSQNSGNSTAASRLVDRNRRSYWGLARMKDGWQLPAVVADLENIAKGLEEAFPDSNENRSLTARTFGSVTVLPAFDTSVDTASGILLGLVLLVLLIASANLANLLLARALARRGEMATRLSLGASRLRIVRQLMMESLLLATVGGAGGLLLAGLCSRLMSQFRFNTTIPLQLAVDLDSRVLLFTVLLAGFAAVAFGLMPAVEASRTDLSSVLREHLGRGGKRLRFQSLMVATQVALSVVLLTFGGLALRSVLNATRVDTGLETLNAAGAVISPRSQGYENDEIRTFYQRLKAELASQPSVASVSTASHLPLSLFINTLDGIPVERASAAPEEWPELDTADVDDTYFETLGIDVLQG